MISLRYFHLLVVYSTLKWRDLLLITTCFLFSVFSLPTTPPRRTFTVPSVKNSLSQYRCQHKQVYFQPAINWNSSACVVVNICRLLCVCYDSESVLFLSFFFFSSPSPFPSSSSFLFLFFCFVAKWWKIVYLVSVLHTLAHDFVPLGWSEDWCCSLYCFSACVCVVSVSTKYRVMAHFLQH